MELHDFSRWLRLLLKPEAFKDYCPNGLCVEGASKVTRVVTGVSFRQELVDEAVRQKADCIVVHHPHGFWSNEPRLPIGALGKRVQTMMRHGISLFGFHLPLDGHPVLGNNILIARGMGLIPEATFMREGQADVGVIATHENGFSFDELCRRYTELLGYELAHALPGPASVHSRIAICSGGGTSGLAEAKSLGCDLFLTGEIKESTPIFAAEEGMAILAGGHHRTEVFGVRALATHIERELGIPAAFHDVDNPV